MDTAHISSAVPGRYSTCAGTYHNNGTTTMHVGVTAVRGNVEFIFSMNTEGAGPATSATVVAAASTVARHAFAAYAHLPVVRGPIPAVTTAGGSPTATSPPPARRSAV
jgi:hypothetical protein